MSERAIEERQGWALTLSGSGSGSGSIQSCFSCHLSVHIRSGRGRRPIGANSLA